MHPENFSEYSPEHSYARVAFLAGEVVVQGGNVFYHLAFATLRTDDRI